MELDKVIFERRSIRRYLQKPVEEKKLINILDAARFAPSIGNLQEWRFIIIRDPKKKKELSDACFGQSWIAEAPVLIAVFTEDEKVVRLYGEEGKNKYIFYDVAAAIQNMLLTAHSNGLGACWVGTFDETAVRRILKLPEDKTLHSLIALGYPAEKPVAPPRWSLNSLIFLEEFKR